MCTAFSRLLSNELCCEIPTSFPKTHTCLSDKNVHIILVTLQALIKAFTAQVGWLSEGFRFSRKRGSWLPALEHRSGVEPKQIGSFTYDFSKGNLQTISC